MASYSGFVEKAVYENQIEYDRRMYATEKGYIKYLKEGRSPKEFAELMKRIWGDIDHEYMEKAIQELKEKVAKDDQVHLAMVEQQMLPDKYELNDIQVFEAYEREFGSEMANQYMASSQRILDEPSKEGYLSGLIQTFEERIGSAGVIYKLANGKGRNVPTSTYLSMLYNVNLRMAAWNQTFKDGEYLGYDLYILESHPHACPDCNEMSGKVYSMSGKDYPNIPKFNGSFEKAYDHGVGHPNCQCEWTIYHNEIQLKNQEARKTNDYEEIQKAKGVYREIQKQENKLSEYRLINDGEMIDKTQDKLDVLNGKLAEYPKYIQELVMI